jgi:large subunit ribosomal protein L35
MPKMKTHRGAAKRFRVTGGGKVMFEHEGMRHIRRTKSSKRKRRLSIPGQVSGSNLKKVKTLIGE